MAARFPCGLEGSETVPEVESRGFGAWFVTLRIDLTGLEALRGRETGVGWWSPAGPSRYTGGSLYSAWVEKPTFFLIRREVEFVVRVEAGDWKPGGVCRLNRVSMEPRDGLLVGAAAS